MAVDHSYGGLPGAVLLPCDKRSLRSDPALAGLHDALAREMLLGHLSRQEVVSMLHYLVQHKGVNMTVAFKDDRNNEDKLDETGDIQGLFSGLRGDRARYKQVLTNVLVHTINLAAENGNVSIVCTVLDL